MVEQSENLLVAISKSDLTIIEKYVKKNNLIWKYEMHYQGQENENWPEMKFFSSNNGKLIRPFMIERNNVDEISFLNLGATRLTIFKELAKKAFEYYGLNLTDFVKYFKNFNRYFYRKPLSVILSNDSIEFIIISYDIFKKYHKEQELIKLFEDKFKNYFSFTFIDFKQFYQATLTMLVELDLLSHPLQRQCTKILQNDNNWTLMGNMFEPNVFLYDSLNFLKNNNTRTASKIMCKDILKKSNLYHDFKNEELLKVFKTGAKKR